MGALPTTLETSEVPDEKKVLPFDNKYLKVETSGLEYEVKSGANDVPIKLEKPKRGRR